MIVRATRNANAPAQPRSVIDDGQSEARVIRSWLTGAPGAPRSRYARVALTLSVGFSARSAIILGRFAVAGASRFTRLDGLVTDAPCGRRATFLVGLRDLVAGCDPASSVAIGVFPDDVVFMVIAFRPLHTKRRSVDGGRVGIDVAGRGA